MSKSVTYPPYLISYPVNREGSGYYRTFEPFRAMKEAGHIQGTVSERMVPPEHIKTLRPDKVLWQLQMRDAQLDVLKAYHKKGVVQVFDTDDLTLSLNDVDANNVHRKELPTDLKARWRKVLANVDRLTVSTEPLAEYFKGLHSDILVTPNYMPRSVLEAIPLSYAHDEKPRIGWAGGISHAGDLAFVKEIMDILGDSVHWVFMGMVPPGELNPALYTQMPVAPCGSHVQAMAKMRLDLALAPLALNNYNRCKSNLKILEYGACGFPVLATDIEPYSDAPVFFPESNTAQGWANSIRELLSDKLVESGVDLRNWVWRNWTLEDNLESRIAAWDGFVPYAENESVQSGLILTQDNVILPPDMEERIAAIAEAHPDLGTLSFWGNDNDFMGYPTPGTFTPLNKQIAEQMDGAAKTAFDGEVVSIPFPVGQVIWVSPKAAVACGGLMGMNTDAAQWMEYGNRLRDRGFVNYAALGIFTATWLPAPRDAELAREDAQCLMARAPNMKDDIVTAQQSDTLRKARGVLEAHYFKDNYPVMSVKGEDFTTAYNHWAQLFESTEHKDSKLDVHVHVIGSKSPLPEADYYAFVHEKDVLDVSTLLDETHGHEAIVYGDEDTLINGIRNNPYFKPDFNYELLLSHNYIGRGALIKADFVEKAPEDEMAYYDLIMQVVESKEFIRHVPHISIHRFPSPPSPSPIGLHFQRIGVMGMITPHPTGFNLVQYAMPADRTPLVSIVIPSKNNSAMLSRCIQSILEKTDYPNYEILVADNGSTDRDTRRLLEALKRHDKMRVLSIPCVPFNYSVVNNYAVAQAKGEYVCLLNDDTEVQTPYWLNLMMRSAIREDVGAVGAKLLYPNGTVQHVGVVTGMPLVADHKFKGIGQNDPGYFGHAICMHEVTAVTGACLLVSKDKYLEVGGLDENYAIAYGDVAFCLSLRNHGYRNIIQPQSILVHYESASRGMDDTPEKLKRHLKEAELINDSFDLHDPFWNVNLSLTPMPSLAWPPRNRESNLNKSGLLYINVPIERRWKDLKYYQVFEAETVDFTHLQIVRPEQKNLPLLSVLDNVNVWKTYLTNLGIDTIYLGALNGVSIVLLNLLRRLSQEGFKIVTVSSDEIYLCPRGDANNPEGPCGDKWKELADNGCVQCIENYGSKNGYVDVEEWRYLWREFLAFHAAN